MPHAQSRHGCVGVPGRATWWRRRYGFRRGHIIKLYGYQPTLRFHYTFTVVAFSQVADSVGEAARDALAHGHPRSQRGSADEIDGISHISSLSTSAALRVEVSMFMEVGKY